MPLSPLVRWAQNAECIRARVELREAAGCSFSCASGQLRLNAQGLGAAGCAPYEVQLALYAPVDADHELTWCRVTDTNIEISLRKVQPAWWPRLQLQAQKPPWLKVDFDRWKSEDDGLDDSEEERRDVMNDYPGMYDKLQKEEMGYRKEDLKKVYLVCYNTFQFIGFLYILFVMSIRYAKYESESMASTYEHVGSALKFVQLMMFLEILHPLFGYTKGGIFAPFLQVTARAFVLFAMIETEPRMQTKPVVFYLIIMWSSIEIVRYPYYITQLYKRDIYLLTWLRYSLWIPLYPLGILCEGVVILRNIPYFEETGKLTVSLPNRWNFAFHMPTMLRIYLLLFFLPGLYVMCNYMWKARVKRFATYKKVIIKKSA